MTDERPAHFGSTEYLGKKWTDKDRRKRESDRTRDERFMEAIIVEEEKKGRKMTWDQARRELQRQQHVSQRELLWEEHRDTLMETSPPKEGREREIRQKIFKKRAPPPVDELAQLRAENAALKEQLDAVTDSYKILNAEFQRWKKEHP